jgi:ribosomal protein S27AE
MGEYTMKTYLCLRCGSVYQLPDGDWYCGKCSNEKEYVYLVEVLEHTTNTLAGKKIKMIAYHQHDTLDIQQNENEVSLTQGRLYIVFEDKTMIAIWVTEFGGIRWNQERILETVT